MEYRPDAKTIVRSFMVGRVVEDYHVRDASSPSIFVFDRKAVIETGGVSASSATNGFELEYASSSYPGLEVSKMYLFAIAGEVCVGFLEVKGEHAILPDGSSTALNAYISAHIGRPLPDYYGFEA